MNNPQKFRKKPIVVDAVCWDGSNAIWDQVNRWERTSSVAMLVDRRLSIATLEGTMLAELGDWVIRGVKHELYPCKPDIFEATYEPV